MSWLLVFAFVLAVVLAAVWAVRRRRVRTPYPGVNPPIIEFLSTELNRFPLHQAVFKNDFSAVELHAAAACQSGVKVIKVLLKHGADFRIKDAAGMTPCQLAEKYKHYKISAYLKFYGA